MTSPGSEAQPAPDDAGLRVGTAGWAHARWRRRFYPVALAERDWLDFYAREFALVEVDGSHGLPEAGEIRSWLARTPGCFTFSVRAPRSITHDKKLKVAREPFMQALRRAALLGTKDTQAVRYHFQREGLELTSRVPEVGETRISFPLDWPFDELEIGFNPHYFVDVLRVLDTAELDLELKDAVSAAVVRESDDQGQFVYLVMPLNLSARAAPGV